MDSCASTGEGCSSPVNGNSRNLKIHGFLFMIDFEWQDQVSLTEALVNPNMIRY